MNGMEWKANGSTMFTMMMHEFVYGCTQSALFPTSTNSIILISNSVICQSMNDSIVECSQQDHDLRMNERDSIRTILHRYKRAMYTATVGSYTPQSTTKS